MKSVRYDKNIKGIYNSGTSNLSDDLRKMILFFSIEVLISTLWILSPYKSKLVSLSSEKFDISPIRSIILSRSAFRMCE